MDLNVLNQYACRLESLIRRTETFGKSKDDILDELLMIAEDLRVHSCRFEHQASETNQWYDTSAELM